MGVREIITDWSMKEIWNDASLRPDRPIKPREILWASELTRPCIDRFLAMKGMQPTNLPNARSKRKFLMGHIIEEMQGIVISTLGLKVEKQQEVWTNGIIPVKGKVDFLIQGIPNYEKARHDISSLLFSEEFKFYLLSVVDKFEEKIGNNEIAPIIRECKSCSHYVAEMIASGGSVAGHKMQLYHYLKGMNIPLGYVDYLSKEDAIMEESRVEYPDEKMELMYDSELKNLKAYLDADEMPPPAPLILFEEKFKKNIFVEYSNYLTLVYGFEQPMDYADSVKGKIASWNRTLKRLKDINAGVTTKTGKPTLLTDKNKLVIEEMAREGYDANALSKIAVVVEEEEELV